MVKSVVLKETGSLGRLVRFEVPEENFDLRQAVRAAAAEYCRTGKGRRSCMSHKGLDCGRFVRDVPNEICEEYGFRKEVESEELEIVDSGKMCVSVEEMVYSQTELCRMNEKHAVCETAMRFARIWGIMETLDLEKTLSDREFEDCVGSLMKWAEEFVAKQQKDVSAFFHEKLKEIRS